MQIKSFFYNLFNNQNYLSRQSRPEAWNHITFPRLASDFYLFFYFFIFFQNWSGLTRLD